MTHRIAARCFILGISIAWSVPGYAQTIHKVAGGYDRTTETTTTGTILTVVGATGPDGVVGVHLDLKTDRGIVDVHVAPALFIGENNFWLQAQDEVVITGSRVFHDGEPALWARSIKKGAKTLTLRNESGTPLWKVDAATDPDGCGVVHAPVPSVR
jgi:hypothetical protein